MQRQIRLEPYLSFSVSPAGRWAKILVGAAIIGYGLTLPKKERSLIVAMSLLPIAAGLLDLCLLGPFVGGHLKGSEMRRALHEQRGFPQIGSSAARWLSV